MNEILPFIVRFVATAVWCLAAMLGVALAVGTVAYCGERLRRFARLGFVLCGLAVCVTLFSVKPPAGNTNGVNQVQAPLRVPRLPAPVEPAADVVRISEITVRTNGVDLVLHRPPTNDLEAVEVVLVGSTNLVAATWEAYTNLVFGVGETNVAVWVDRAQLDAHAVSSSCFFAFINAGDSDGDGLADWHERFNLKTDPDSADSDGDGLRDDWEVAHGRDSRSSVDCVLSTRVDGIPDVYVIQHGGNPDSPSDAALVPVFTASENSETNLAAALAASVPYSIVEVEPGIHEGSGWTGIRFPPHPVYVRPTSGGPNRTVLRHRDRVGMAGGGMAAFEIPSGTPPGTCVEGLRSSSVKWKIENVKLAYDV